MNVRRREAGGRKPWQSKQALLAVPIVLIVVITAVDQLVPEDVHLSPLLVVAPAITIAFAGPWLTALVGFLTVVAQAYIGWRFNVLMTRNVLVQILALAVMSALAVLFCVVRERHRRQLARVRTVAEATQHVLLWPLPDQLGSVQVAVLYLAAEDEAQIGGDLYAATSTETGVRIMIGDVRGKGLPAIGEAALLIGAFREAAHEHAGLPQLAAALERSVTRNLASLAPVEENEERFATALLVEIPEEGGIARIISCGHPPPLLISADGVVLVPVNPAPPLGTGSLGPVTYTVDMFSFQPGDTLLLYTDGVIEARGIDGGFYPFVERAAQWTGYSPEKLVHFLRCDLLAHAGGRLDDDAAVIALCRSRSTHSQHLEMLR
ncbi:PP2C family protein-serine/threonine phosphatase [Streptomyces collinus]|uniref:PP2C family protein-serine/threonine phosphatase n=1 Tax=Streptomyces collinus TaxID=42684 RepID=UPI00368E78D0